ncbi:MAG: cellulase family glycosylhydrolase [Gaiellaceae bacterium]
MRPLRLLALACLAFAALATTSGAADRMWVGFTDDPTLRFGADRQEGLDLAARSGATIVRTVVIWSTVARSRPAGATDPFDPGYQLDDLDELTRNAQARGLEVLITIWGTPGWANGGRGPQYAPTDVGDLRDFAQALASRYSGRYPGYPFVRFFGIWNESNLATFLRPQFDARGRIVGPAVYARLAAAGYAGIKAGNAAAQVAIGETSSNGRQKHVAGLTDAVAPGRFVELVARANPKLRFDAWAQHPYPLPVSRPPTQVVAWPNVTLTSLAKLETTLDDGFGRAGIPIWITEYGHETRPGEPRGVTEEQQASYLTTAVGIARRDPRVQMFIWFILRDSPSSAWQSGLYREDGTPKPARAAWPAAVGPLNARNGKVAARGGTTPVVTVYIRDFCANNPAGAAVGTTTRVRLAGRLVGIRQAQLSLGIDCTVRVRLPVTVVRGKTYAVTITLNIGGGNEATRGITVVGT